MNWMNKIEALVEGIPLNQLAKESEQLTSLYRQRKPGTLPPLKSRLQKLAYLCARMPSTHAVICKVLTELKKYTPALHSALDVGSGPGTALFALDEMQIGIKKATLLERDSEFISLAKQLSVDLDSIEKTWICKDVLQPGEIPVHDLVIASYCLNELEEKSRLQVVEKLWALTGQFLILIEPGNAIDFAISKEIRQKLITLGGHLVAPCPHQNACPLSAPDWCHFAARLERSSLQRKVKGASLNYEDEKFFYLIFSKENRGHCSSRVLKRPVKGEGFVKIQLCSTSGIEDKVITKKNKPIYPNFKKLEWGDSVDF
jgi:ribosomal protein RSM22 (predicted rRNA methylase)